MTVVFFSLRDFVLLWDFKDGRLCFSVLLQDFNDRRSCFVRRFQWLSVLFNYEILVTVSFIRLWNNNGQFCSFTRFQWQSVLLGYKISMTVGFQCQSVLFCYEISKTVSFVPLFFYKISKTDGLVSLGDFDDCWLYSVTVGFAGLWDFNDGRFSSSTRFQWQSVLLGYEISVMVGFVLLWDFKNGWFCSSVIKIL